MKKKIIEKCYQRSVELLKKNSCEFGFLASSFQKKAIERNYLSVFARDASICSLGALASQDKKLIKIVKKSLLTLARNQSKNGQIPNYVKPENKRVDFWRLGCIDATLWWLIALKIYDQYAGDQKLLIHLESNFKRALFWLECQEHAEDNLLMQGEASDWADLMPRSGKVLYSNALWCYVKKLYKIKDLKKTVHSFNNLFFPYEINSKNIWKCNRTTVELIQKKVKKENQNCYLSSVAYLDWTKDIDVYGNVLAIIFDLASFEQTEKIIEFFNKKRKKKNFPIPVIFNPIRKTSKYWRKYMESHNQNFSYQYHNGGIWPFVSCFFAIALSKIGKQNEAWEELEKIAIANSENNWQFNEWMHGINGKPSGMHYQSWNAGMFLFAVHYLKKEIKF